VAEVECGDGVLRHIVKIAVAQYNVKATAHVAKLRRNLSV
jgi:hypothetical protein